MSDVERDFDMEIPVAPEVELEFGEEAPAAPELTVIPDAGEEDDITSSLTPQEREKVSAFVEKIDITNTAGVLAFGVGSQRKVSEFSERALAGVRGRDLGEVGEDINKLVVTLRNFDPDQKEGGILGLFNRAKNNLESLKTRYTEVEKNVRSISDVLEGHQRTLLKDISMLDQLYALNEAYFKELTMYVAAGREKLSLVRAGELAQLQAKAQASGLAEDAQLARDLAQKCDRFEKRIFDLELTRQVALQTAPQIRMVQASDAVMAEKIQSTVVNTIPLWKNQMVLALGVEHANQAARAQREVSEMTNELLRKNADRLKVATVESAKEAERGVVDLDTLRHTNEQLISTLDEVSRIQAEGRERRRLAEAELGKIEGELKAKLLAASQH
ncbi:toxic anion resistance protein [Olsenella urininfantis]|uniref:toxic anion resistance protein n=1 Tax=Olsenella urininfantis TaxID=1871033 RepID=UPI000984D65F|nr:toxic anion resistance protein [Olsenella urininfantis]